MAAAGVGVALGSPPARSRRRGKASAFANENNERKEVSATMGKWFPSTTRETHLGGLAHGWHPAAEGGALMQDGGGRDDPKASRRGLHDTPTFYL